jgi:hypothetical protein
MIFIPGIRGYVRREMTSLLLLKLNWWCIKKVVSQKLHKNKERREKNGRKGEGRLRLS